MTYPTFYDAGISDSLLSPDALNNPILYSKKRHKVYLNIFPVNEERN